MAKADNRPYDSCGAVQNIRAVPDLDLASLGDLDLASLGDIIARGNVQWVELTELQQAQ